MPRYYVEKNGEWNIFSTIVDDFILDEFVCLDALKARLLYERYKELTEDIDSLLTDNPRVNVMDYEEAMERRREQAEPQTEGIWNAGYKTGYGKGYKDAQKVKDSQDLVKDLVKTENCSEIPNNCETCRFELYCPEMCEGCCEWDSHYEPKTEPTISKMEQVDEPHIVGKHADVIIIDEPQTERSSE